MKSSRSTFALIAGLIVGASALYESQATQADACAYLAKAANQAAQAPSQPNATATLGFTPMREFDKIYAPVCQPRNANADLFSSLIAGAITAVLCYFGLSVLAFARRFKSIH